MEVACEKCGARHRLSEQQVGDHARVQFRCTKCSHVTTVDTTRRPDRTYVSSPLPSFARGEGGVSVGADFIGEHQDLFLPFGKTITLTMLSGPAPGRTYTIARPRIVLGRSGADLEINDPQISRWHCALEIKGDVIRLRDLDSTNGTFISDERVRAAELADGAEFRIGTTTLRLAVKGTSG